MHLLALSLLAALAGLRGVHGHMVFMGVAGKGTMGIEGRPQYPAVPGNTAPFNDENHAPRDCRGCDAPYKRLPGQWWDFRLNGLQSDQYRNTKLLQCRGNPKGKARMTFAANETIDLIWGFAVPHYGPVHLYMSFDNDQTWVLLTQMVDTFIPSNFNALKRKIDTKPIYPSFLVQRIKLPANLPSSKQATLRTEFMDGDATQAWIGCIDIETVGPGSPIAANDPGAFKIEGLANGAPSQMPKLFDPVGNSTSNRMYQYDPDGPGWDLRRQGWSFRDYQDKVWPSKGGKPVYDFGKRDRRPVDYAKNIEVVAERSTPTNGKEWPGLDYIKAGEMNPL